MGILGLCIFTILHGQYGRVSFHELIHNGINGTVDGYTVTYYDSTTKESSAPSATVTSSDASSTYNKNFFTLSTKSNSGWSTQEDGDSYVVSKATLAWWNGAYSSNNSSNLTYAHQGTIQCKPTNLYNNSSGATGTITLSQSAANFNYIEIFYRNNDNRHSSTRIYRPNTGTQNIFLWVGYLYNDVSQLYIKAKEITINGTSLSITRGGDLTGDFTYIASNDVIYITRIDGYK